MTPVGLEEIVVGNGKAVDFTFWSAGCEVMRTVSYGGMEELPAEETPS